MKSLVVTGCLVAALASPCALAALDVGDAAPDFTTRAALAGQEFAFSMAQARASGPVVLYFYPAAFTQGCTLEAHSFAEAIDDYKAMGASVIGISHDDIDTLKKFSVSACGNKFAVGADTDAKIIRAYDAELASRPGQANRISYVISPAGQIIYEYSSMDPELHVKNTLEAVRSWKAKNQP